MEPFLGQICMVGFNFAPRGWAQCYGQLLPIAQNSALFSLLGTIYGGDGRTTFGLPDLRGRVAVGEGQGPGLPNFPLGSRGGATTTTLSVANIPAHSHTITIRANNAGGTTNNPTSAIMAETGFGDNEYTQNAPDVNMSASMAVCGNTGGGQAFNNLQPFYTVNYIIALVGVFPSRS